MTPEIISVEDAEKLSALVSAADSATRAVARQVGYVLPCDSTDPVMICKDIAANMRRSVENCLEVGRGLLVLKASCGHGRFLEYLDLLKMDRGLAARFISAAQKFSNVPTSAHLISSVGTQSKLLELLVLDDEQIDELAETGQTGKLALDDVACMGVRELRKALRKERARIEAKDKVIADKSALIDTLQEEAVTDSDDDAAPDPVRTVDTAVALAIGEVIKVGNVISRVLGHDDSPLGVQLREAAARRVIGAARQLAADLGLPLLVANSAIEERPADPVGAEAEMWENAGRALDAAHAAKRKGHEAGA